MVRMLFLFRWLKGDLPGITQAAWNQKKGWTEKFQGVTLFYSDWKS